MLHKLLTAENQPGAFQSKIEEFFCRFNRELAGAWEFLKADMMYNGNQFCCLAPTNCCPRAEHMAWKHVSADLAELPAFVLPLPLKLDVCGPKH